MKMNPPAQPHYGGSVGPAGCFLDPLLALGVQVAGIVTVLLKLLEDTTTREHQVLRVGAESHAPGLHDWLDRQAVVVVHSLLSEAHTRASLGSSEHTAGLMQCSRSFFGLSREVDMLQHLVDVGLILWLLHQPL